MSELAPAKNGCACGEEANLAHWQANGFCFECGTRWKPTEDFANLPSYGGTDVPAGSGGLGGIWGMVVEDMKKRDAFGFSKYNKHLEPHDGRDSLKDAYEEALDLAVYLRKAIYERDGK